MIALVFPLSLFTTNCASAPPTAVDPTHDQTTCLVSQRTLVGDEIAKLVVGNRVSYAPENRKCSRGIVVTSPLWMDLRSDGTVSFRFDYVKKEGRYRVVGDRLCFTLPNSDRLVAGRIEKTPGEQTYCHTIVVDAAGLHYMSGHFIGRDGLDPIAVTTIDE